MKATRQQEKEFIALVEEYKQVIYKVCYVYASDADHLNDLYQEVVINLWKAYPRFRGECKSSTWVYRIGLNTCISFFRQSKRKPEVVPISVDLDAFAEDEDKTAQLRELYRMINRLSQLERALILLWLEERSYQEIADIMGISKNNVAVKLNRIREKLKTMSNS
ncbi:sigma-70 family RNA polymerase sigma factor [Parabacteroides sp. AF48-14]|uniref:RNA polymerase sigma factor n=1 Tax=Parabacteroides sp. AF48-14 TaxID=2292052 RepID=UPI000EFF3A49|nr:sigma-70 family RNA polymerase sigma factor [Parabacteroides sp. AF48-14]RHO72933.1 sigma-70 family RNA polymerase sigma factor [Parabacteroides sp. AF48-14]